MEIVILHAARQLPSWLTYNVRQEMEFVLQFLREFRDGVFLVLGALIGFVSSVAMWRRQLREAKRRKKADYILRAIHLAGSSLTYARALLYSKTKGIEGVLCLPENPVDELMALAGLHLREISPLVQRLHDKQQELFGDFSRFEDPAGEMLRIVGEMPVIVNQLMKRLGELSEQNEKA